MYENDGCHSQTQFIEGQFAFNPIRTRVFGKCAMYQSIPSLTIPWATPRDLHILTAWGLAFAQLSLPGASGFGIREIFYSCERKMQERLDLFQKKL